MATHDGEKHTRQSLRRSPEFRELAELMAGIDPERRADAFTLEGIQENDSDGQEQTTADNATGGARAGPDKFGKIVVPTDD